MIDQTTESSNESSPDIDQREDRWKRWVAGSILLLICLAGSVGVLYATRECPGMSADSRTYLIEADSVRRGDGVMMRAREGHPFVLGQYPPLYPILIAAGSVFSEVTRNAARDVNVLLIFGSAALAAGIVRTIRFGDQSGGSRTLAISAAAMIALSSETLQTYSMIWSEGAFIFFALLSIFMLCLAMRRDDRGKRHWAFFVCSAAAAAAAFGTRFAGATLIPASMLILLFDPKAGWRSRLLRAALFAFIASSICVPWVIRNSLNDGIVANRALSLHHPGMQVWGSGATTVTGWFTFGWKGKPNVFGAIVSLVLLVIAGTARLKARGAIRNWFSWGDLPFLVAATYVPFLCVALLLVDAYMPLDRRILYPLYVLSVLTVASWVGVWNQPRSSKRTRTIVAAFCVAMVSLQLMRGIRWVESAPGKWLGYGSHRWTQSTLIQQVRMLPKKALIYSNGEDVIYLQTGIFVKSLPGKFDAAALINDKKYASKMKALRDYIRLRSAYVVHFNSVKRTYHATEKELQQELRLSTVFRSNQGAIMWSTPKKSNTK